MSKDTKKQKLDKLKSQMESNYAKLPLVNKAKDLVPAEGNPEAEIFFIGEAAGYHEHVQRKPFVGAAGKLLIKSLKDNGWEREEVWISNVVKARPPQNRDPKPEEIEAFKPYLDQEIEIIRPKIIVTLGRFSMAKFIPNVFISKIHGQPRWIDWNKKRILVFPMYHPAAALRNGNVLQMFTQDFKKLRKTLDTLNKQTTENIDEIQNTNNQSSDNSTQEPINSEENQQLQLI